MHGMARHLVTRVGAAAILAAVSVTAILHVDSTTRAWQTHWYTVSIAAAPGTEYTLLVPAPHGWEGIAADLAVREGDVTFRVTVVSVDPGLTINGRGGARLVFSTARESGVVLSRVDAPPTWLISANGSVPLHLDAPAEGGLQVSGHHAYRLGSTSCGVLHCAEGGAWFEAAPDRGGWHWAQLHHWER